MFRLEYRSFPDAAGPIEYAPVPWDSETFGFPVYELSARGIAGKAFEEHLPRWVAEVVVARPSLVFTKIPGDAIGASRMLAGHGFYPMEIMYELSLPLLQFRFDGLRRAPEGSVAPAAGEDLGEVVAIAKSAFSADRFHLDPQLPAGKADERYASWIARGHRDRENIFVYRSRSSSQVLGFLHLQDAGERTVRLSLVAVKPGIREVGVGAILFQTVLKQCQESGFRNVVTHVSATNLPMVNLVARLGFKFVDAVWTFHRFFGPEDLR